MAKGANSKGAASGGGNGVSVIVLQPGGGDGRYSMFEVRDISKKEAFLQGPLVLEVGEPLDLELGFKDGSSLKVAAEVLAAELGDSPGVKVKFQRSSDRKKLAKKLK